MNVPFILYDNERKRKQAKYPTLLHYLKIILIFYSMVFNWGLIHSKAEDSKFPQHTRFNRIVFYGLIGVALTISNMNI